MRQNLGKIIALLFISINLIAGVNISVEPPAIYKGESVVFTITADGEDVVFPEIDEVGGFAIEGTSSSQSTTVINGSVKRAISKSYQFSPKKSVKIPSFEVKVDGETFKTKEKKVSVVKPTASKNGAEFVLEAKVDKKTAHVGEAINLTLLFKQRLDAKAVKLQLGEPKIENFWIKKVDGVEKYEEGEYLVQKLHYVLFPQKAGEYTLPQIEAAIGKVAQRGRRRGGIFDDPFFNDPFFSSFTNQIKWKKIYSDEIKLDIKPLVDNLELFGDFKIEATVDKKEVKANKPTNLTITVKGVGNIDDVKKFELDIDGVVVYADEPKIEASFVGDAYGGEFTQKVAIIADKNYTIPAISLTFVDKKTNKPKTISSTPIDINVLGASNKELSKPKIETQNSQIEEPKIEKPTQKDELKSTTLKPKEYKEESYLKYLFLLLGLALGSLLTYLYNRYRHSSNKKESDIVKDIKRAKSDKALFEALLPYSKEDKLISKTLQKLEENIYKNGTHKIDKNELLDFFEEIKPHF
jgi:hypothetical protein